MSNPTVDTILKRRSIRKYTDAPVPEELLDQILNTGLYAPNGGNHQVVRLFVMKGPALDELNGILVDIYRNKALDPSNYQNKSAIRARGEGCNFFFHAPVLISAVAPREHGNSMADAAGALDTMQLTAAALDLGACWINTPHWQTASPAVRRLFEEAGMSPDEDIFGSIVIGYSAEGCPEAKPRKEGRIVKMY